MHINNKRPQLAVSGDDVGIWLAGRASKAALVDLYLSALSRCEGLPDHEPVPVDVVIRDADPVLRLRGDRTLASHAAGEARRAAKDLRRALARQRAAAASAGGDK